MVKSFEELGDALAEFENRISYLENSLPNTPISEQVFREIEQPEKPWTPRQWDTVNQLRGEVSHLQKKLNERFDKRKRTDKYSII